MQQIGYLTLLVPDYDQAVAYFTETLGFELVEDTPLSDSKRWVLVAPGGSIGARILLAKAVSPAQLERVGDQAGGRVFLFLHTDDFWRDYRALKSRGVVFEDEPRRESYGTVAVFRDLFGNRWDLLELATSTETHNLE